MEILAFILIAFIWAAFLLPSFFESRRRAPINATRDFARSTALLASVATMPGTELMARRKARERRRRLLSSLTAGAVISLTVAILQASLVWLGVTLVFDVAIAAYVALLMRMRQRATAQSRVVTLTAVPSAPVEHDAHTVRVVAG